MEEKTEYLRHIHECYVRENEANMVASHPWRNKCMPGIEDSTGTRLNEMSQEVSADPNLVC